jgi:RNA polymerase sigma-70 factor, ECF subfamily
LFIFGENNVGFQKNHRYCCVFFLYRPSLLKDMDTATIWQNFSQNLYVYLRRRVDCPADADDLVQDIFLKIHLNKDNLRHAEGLTQWVWRLTHNTLTDYHRSRKRPGLAAPTDDLAAMPAPAHEEEFTQMLAQCIRPFIDLLPPQQREAIVLADFENISQKELAERWGIGYSGAKSRVQRSRQELEGLFRACCHIEHDAFGNILDYQPHCGKCILE